MDPNTRFRSLITKSRNGRSGAQQSARSAHVVMRPCCTSVNHAPRRVRFLLSLGFGPPRLFRSSRNTLSATEPCRWRSTWCAPSKSSSGGGRTPRLIPPESDPLGPAPGSASDTRPGGETQLRHDEHPLFPQASRCPPKRSNCTSFVIRRGGMSPGASTATHPGVFRYATRLHRCGPHCRRR